MHCNNTYNGLSNVKINYLEETKNNNTLIRIVGRIYISPNH